MLALCHSCIQAYEAVDKDRAVVHLDRNLVFGSVESVVLRSSTGGPSRTYLLP